MKELGANTIPQCNPFPKNAVNKNTTLVIDGAWLSQKKIGPIVKSSLRDAIENKGNVIVAGSNTTELFALLNDIGVHKIGANEDGTLHNPTRMDQPLAGFSIIVNHD